MLTVQHLHASYGSHAVLKGLSFQLRLISYVGISSRDIRDFAA